MSFPLEIPPLSISTHVVWVELTLHSTLRMFQSLTSQWTPPPTQPHKWSWGWYISQAQPVSTQEAFARVSGKKMFALLSPKWFGMIWCVPAQNREAGATRRPWGRNWGSSQHSGSSMNREREARLLSTLFKLLDRASPGSHISALPGAIPIT